MSEIRSFLERTPTVTRTLLVSTVVISSLSIFSSTIHFNVVHDWHAIIYRWQIWRPLTGFFFANMRSLPGLMDIYWLYTLSKDIETGKFHHNSIDYGFYLFIIMPLIVLLSVFIEMHSMLTALVGALTYTWSRANRYNEVMVNFIKVQAEYLPIATLAFTFLLMGSQMFFAMLGGMCTAYFYQCLESRTLGPVYKFICDSLGVESQRENPTNRVGTVHTLTQLDGYLSAPIWFRKAFASSARPTEKGKGRVNTLNGGTDISSSTASGSSWGSASFRGQGHRLGN